MAFPHGDKPIRIAVLGLVDGNGHPYSWSAIVNGYDREAMASCPYAGIPVYLGKEPPASFGIPGVRVTHIWTDDPAEAPKIAKASNIDSVLARPEDAIGRVDAVWIATDIGSEHVERSRPFVEAGLPVFVDKPLVDNAEAPLKRDGIARRDAVPYRAAFDVNQGERVVIADIPNGFRT